MKTNQAGIDLIKKWEGLRLTPYYCSGNKLTIGYGHTSAAGEPIVTPELRITASEAEDILKRDLAKFEAIVLRVINAPISENQFAAMVSLCFNIGGSAFAKSSVARLTNARDYHGAAESFALWNKAGGKVVAGLVKRRADEAALYRKNSKAETAKPISAPAANETAKRAKPNMLSRITSLFRAGRNPA